MPVSTIVIMPLIMPLKNPTTPFQMPSKIPLMLSHAAAQLPVKTFPIKSMSPPNTFVIISIIGVIAFKAAPRVPVKSPEIISIKGCSGCSALLISV